MALTLLGITAFIFIPTSLLPNIDVPKIVININGENLSVNQIESNITEPIRNSLLQLKGIADIESVSSDGKSMVHLRFDPGTNISTSYIEVNEKIDAAMNLLPKDVLRPTVMKLETANIPVYNLNISPKDSNIGITDISNVVRFVIKRRIEQLPEVSMVDLSGYIQPQIQLEAKESYLKAVGLDHKIISDAFKENKIDLGNILVKDGHYQYYLKFLSDFQNISAIENVPLNINGRLFKLGDLAEISYANAPENGVFFNNGKQAINLSILKQQNAKMDDLKKNFLSLFNHLIEDYPQLKFEISQDQTILLDYAVRNLWQDLLLGGLFAFILMLVFVRKIRSALLIGITVPLSLALSQLGFFIFGISLNVISLGGVILGLAMIIDNSIVVIDNINRLKDSGMDLEEATVRGTNEVVRPLITSVLTNCAVFIPLIFMSGLAGAIFYDQAISIIIGVISSLIVALVLLPPLYKFIYSNKKNKRNLFEIKSYVHVTGWYEFVLKRIFSYPITCCFAVGCLLCFTALLFNILKKDRFPPITRYDSELTIDWNENINLKESEKRINYLFANIKDISESSIWVGEQQYLLSNTKNLEYNQSTIYFKVVHKDSLQKKKQEFVTLLSDKYPLALYSFNNSKNAFDEIFADELPPLRLNVNTSQNALPDIGQTKLIIDKLQILLPDAKINPIAIYDKIVLRINAEKAAFYKVRLSDIGQRIQYVFKSEFIDNYQDAQALVPIVMAVKAKVSVIDMLAQTYIINGDNVHIPLKYVVDIGNESDYKYTTAGVQGAYYPINIYTPHPKRDLDKIEALISKSFKDLSVEYKGSYFDNNKLIYEMAVILVVSVLLLYFILAAQFESLVQPLFILVELPIALSGAFIFLYMAGNSLNLMSMIGIVVMCGMIINDSILKIDAINQLRRQGIPLMEAIYKGGHKRLKPIVMISLTSIGSLLPTLFMHDLGSELQKPLALALIGGMFIGLFVSLFFVPLLYWFVYRGKTKIEWLNKY